jgi:hypothetical protein
MAAHDIRIDKNGMLILMLLAGASAVLAVLVDPANLLAQISRDAFGAIYFVFPILPILIIAVAIAEQPGAPFTALVRILKTRGPSALIAIICFFLSMAAFSVFKTNIPEVVPFWADDLFIALDDAVFSEAPWIWLHERTPRWLGEIILRAYEKPWFIYWFGTYFAVAWTAPSALRARYLLSFLLVLFLLGGILATAMSSMGPIFLPRLGDYPAFAGLEEALLAVPHGHTVINYSGYLYTLYETGKPGLASGISAFPSIHCASVFLNALYFSTISRTAGIAAWSFAGLIYIGSIYTGWHYAVDGIGSLIGVLLIWRLSAVILASAEGMAAFFQPRPALAAE